jgi:hypothetical protein
MEVYVITATYMKMAEADDKTVTVALDMRVEVCEGEHVAASYFDMMQDKFKGYDIKWDKIEVKTAPYEGV